MLKFFQNKDNRGFFSFWLAQLISQFGDRVHQMACVCAPLARGDEHDNGIDAADPSDGPCVCGVSQSVAMLDLRTAAEFGTRLAPS